MHSVLWGQKSRRLTIPGTKAAAPARYHNQSRLRPAVPRTALLLCPTREPRHHCNPSVFPVLLLLLARMIPVRPRIPNPGSSMGSEASPPKPVCPCWQPRSPWEVHGALSNLLFVKERLKWLAQSYQLWNFNYRMLYESYNACLFTQNFSDNDSKEMKASKTTS